MKQKLHTIQSLALGVVVVFAFFSFALPVSACADNLNGSITVCKMIVDNEGAIATSTDNLPEGAFSIAFSSGEYATSSVVFDTFSLNANAFSPNEKILSDVNDAYCVTFDGLSENGSYFYSEETVSGSDWISKKYNDQYSDTFNSISDVFKYSGELWNSDFLDDEARNINADGHITLSSSRSHRTLLVVNTYEKQTPEEPEEPEFGFCPFPEAEGRTIAEFDGTKIRSDQTESNSKIEKSLFLNAGIYNVTLVGSDAYTARVSVSQPHESYALILKNGGTTVATTAETPDLEDNIIAATSTLSIENFIVSSSINTVIAYHPYYFDDSSANSVAPVCAVFDRVGDIEEPEESTVTLIATKIVCDLEEDLPNWGEGGSNIGVNTAVDWVEEHDGCEFAKGFEFEWAPIGTSNPDNDLPTNPFFGAAGGNWTIFGPTGGDGVATTSVNLNALGDDSYVWMREVLQQGFIPFTYGPSNQSNENNESAEIYCNTDVLNYDNYDRVDNLEAGETYYCVAFNVAEAPVENPVCSDGLDNDSDGHIDIEDAACHTDGNSENPSSYNPNINSENSKPVITLLGDNPIVLTAGDGFIDPGAMADDEEDGDITVNIVVGGDTVNPNVAGSYTITYNVVDSEGLAADEVTRTVTVEQASNPGIIHICKLIVDENNTVVTSSGLLPTGIFSILLATSTDILNTTIETVSWNASTFTPNRIFTSSSEDTQCHTISNLPLGSYFYGEETIVGIQWATTTKYNDGNTSAVNNVFDFFSYDDALFTATTTDDAGRDTNADGNIVLSADRYERTLVILNKFSSETVPTQCSDQIDNDNDGHTDIEDAACHTDGDPENPDSYDPDIDSENEKPVITLVGSSHITQTVGISYTDEGSTANDHEDGDITSDIVIGGDSVDTSTPGSYMITFNVVDSEGLAADEVARTVTVESTGGEGGGDGGCTSNCGGGGGGGGGPVITLQISNETVEQAGPGTVIVKWNTNISATRKVLYGTESIFSLLLPPVYGYATTTSQITDPLLTLHSVVITGLTPGETYYFRPWASGSGHIATGIELTIVPGTSSAPIAPQSCYYLYDFLKQGENNNPIEVRKLQVFLNEFEGENLEVNGVFDDATFDAVSRFQEKYQGDILTPWGHSASTGYVYILTKKQVNEIYCQSAFPVTSLEQDEIDSFRAFLLSLTEAGIITEGEASSPIAPFGNINPSDVEGGVIDENTVGVGGGLDENDRNIAGVGGFIGSRFGLLRPGFLSSFAAAAFALPTNIPDAFVCFFTLLLALIIIYVASSLIIGTQNVSKWSQSQIRVRKILYFIVGVIVALVGAIYFNVFCLILPLTIVFLILLALLLWYSTRKDGIIGGSPSIKPMVMPSMPTPSQKTETKTDTPTDTPKPSSSQGY